MSLPVAILAGGLATRLQPLTEKVPKSLLEVAGQPFAVHQINLLKKHGLTRIVFCVGHLGERILTELGDGQRWGVNLTYVFDGPQLLGTGGALRRALPFLGDAFFVLYGDSYLECDYPRIERAFGESRKQGLMTVFRNENQWDRSNVMFANGSIMQYDKRQPTGDMQHIDYGLGILKASVFQAYPQDSVLDLVAIYEDLLKQGDLGGYEVPDRFYEIGSYAGLQDTRNHLERKVGQASCLAES
jgi:NDP-sugar pyrophosphorylase family protein